MAGVGYGTEGGTKYWLLQNSWGSGGWGVDGYGKVLRGRDLAGIEKNAFWVKAWVSGGKKPACSDGQSTGLSAGGQDITCKEAKGGRYGNLCDHGQYGHYVKASCPVTCNSCLEIGTDNGGTPAPGPGPSPPGPAPPGPAPPGPAPPAPPPPGPVPPAPPGPPVDSACVKDATNFFKGAFKKKFKCAVWNSCSKDVVLRCKNSACTQNLGDGGLFWLKCDGKVSTEFCDDKSQCEVTEAMAPAPAPPPPSPGPPPPPAPGPPPPPPPPAPPADGGPSKPWQKEILWAHNLYRCMHGVPLMTWNEEVGNAAQQWMDEKRGAMSHSPKSRRSNVGGHGYLGENLAMGSHITAAGAVKMWYDEIEQTNPRGIVRGFSGGTGHYTQVVWKKSVDLGCGLYDKTYCCMYGPGGNMMNDFESNVFAPVKSESECRQSLPPAPPPAPSPGGGGGGGSGGGGSGGSRRRGGSGGGGGSGSRRRGFR